MSEPSTPAHGSPPSPAATPPADSGDLPRAAGAPPPRHGGLRLEAVGLTVARSRRILLEDLDLRVAAGEIVHVAGENGCGKSSLLRVLAGDVEPRRGRVVLPSTWAYVPERMALPDALPARRWLRLLGAGGAELPAELDRRCGSLSKGQLQRLALSAALHGSAELIILDEPWSGLDVAARAQLDLALRAAADRGAAIVFTDHGAAGSLTASTRLHLGAGPPRSESLRPFAHAGATPSLTRTARIVLVRGPERRETRVAVDERDAHLARALADGWGVERVEPDA